MRRFLVEVDDRGACNVIDEYGRETLTMTLGEMLEQMVELCHPKIGRARFGMLTPEGWEERARASEERRRQRVIAEAIVAAESLGLLPRGTLQ